MFFRIPANQLEEAINLLEGFKNDLTQFDKNHPYHIEFLNVGIGILDEKVHSPWKLICEHPTIFGKTIDKLGMAFDGKLDIDETVFRMK
jgi:hypothetical protein